MQNDFKLDNGESAFISYRENAWHMSGMVVDAKMSAIEAYNRMMGDTRIEYREYPLIPMTFDFSREINGMWEIVPEVTDPDFMEAMDSGKKAIYQFDAKGRPVGLVTVVSKKWHLITPQNACEIWDKAMSEIKKEGYGDPHIETMGFLNGRNGTADRFWVATRENPIDIKGDQIRTYVTVYISMDDDSTLMIVLTPVRTVCENTWKAGIASLTRKIQVAHSSKAPEQLKGAIQTAYLGLGEGVLGLQTWLNALADKRMSEPEVKDFFAHVYELPGKPKADYHGSMEKDKKLSLWQQKIEAAEQRRLAAFAGWSGGSFDYADTPAELRDTAYYAFQMVTQFASHTGSKAPVRSLMEPTGTYGLEVARAESWMSRFVK